MDHLSPEKQKCQRNAWKKEGGKDDREGKFREIQNLRTQTIIAGFED